MRLTPVALLLSLMVGGIAPWACAAPGKAYTDPKEAGPEFAIQGEYVGEVETAEKGKVKVGVQIIALGDGKFHAVGYPGGLPGDGWNGKDKKETDGKTDGDSTVFKGEEATLTITKGVATVTGSGGEKLGELKKVMRVSKTMGAKPPEGAIVLFDGKSTDAWENGRMTEDGLLMEGVKSKKKFQSYTSHIEFLLPFMPEARGQGRANSGYYIQGRYELQMLDSFGLSGENNECGGLYTLAKPSVNMCYPPLSWQTYDVDFTAPEFKDGKKVKNAKVVIRHNDVVIHDFELPKESPGGIGNEGPEPGAIELQNHGNPVRYRNIWVVEKK